MTARLGIWSLPLGSVCVLASKKPEHTRTMRLGAHTAALVDQPGVALLAWLRCVRLAPPTEFAAVGLGGGLVGKAVS